MPNPSTLASSRLSILSPPLPAGHALVETRHRLVGAADLYLVKGGLVAVAAVGRALHLALLRVVPGARAAEDVVLLRALKGPPGEDGLGDLVLEGAGAAFEAVVPRVCEGDGEDVCAVGADCRGGEERLTDDEQFQIAGFF